VFARRFSHPAAPNTWTQTRESLLRQGVELTELTDSNPTRHGLMDPRVLDVLAAATRDSSLYDPSPRGPLAARKALAGRYGGDPADYWLAASTSEAYSWLFALLTDPAAGPARGHVGSVGGRINPATTNNTPLEPSPWSTDPVADSLQGDRIALPAPGYPLLEPLARLHDVATAAYRLSYVHPYGWDYDTDQFARLVSQPSTRAAVVVDPGNPTGAYVAPAVRERIVEACAAASCPLIVDEVFHDFPAAGVAEVTGLADTTGLAGATGVTSSFGGETRTLTFTLQGLSKLLCAPGLKLAWLRCSGPADAVVTAATALDEIADTFLSVATPVARALPGLLELADESTAGVRARLDGNEAIARTVFDDEVFRVRRREGGWTLLLDVPRVLSDDDLAHRLMVSAHLAVHPGWFYDIDDEGVLALSLLPVEHEFRRHCERLRDALDFFGDNGSHGDHHHAP